MPYWPFSQLRTRKSTSLDENGENEDGEVYLYRYYEENGQPNLDNIDSDEEYEIAADAFDELMDTEQFNEMEENSTEE